MAGSTRTVFFPKAAARCGTHALVVRPSLAEFPRFLSASKFPKHHQLRYQGIARYSRVWCAQGVIERPADSWFACRSILLWFAASYVCHKPLRRGRNGLSASAVINHRLHIAEKIKPPSAVFFRPDFHQIFHQIRHTFVTNSSRDSLSTPIVAV